MPNVKQVKVDNWGIYFLQRLKHFFNRTDFCDLTLQFQDNAQLKVHRLVLSACTEYFELLERTCEMYEDCLVMPDDLQADVVVPIVNFMYTGQLQFKMDLLEKLYLTSQIMQMPVLTKLLEAHRNISTKPAQCYTAKRKRTDSTPSTSSKRSYNKAFDNTTAHTGKKVYVPVRDREDLFSEPSSSQMEPKSLNKQYSKSPRPTRYELPEELDTDNVFDNSFCNISYTSKPLMVHPETVKHYSAKHNSLFGEPSSSKRFSNVTSTMDIVECKKISNDNIFEDTGVDHSIIEESTIFQPTYLTVKDSGPKDTNQLFDQILDQNDTPKLTIDKKNNKGMPSLDHAKIISEVLKKYSHILKGSKNIKLKILNTSKRTGKKQKSPLEIEEKPQMKEEKIDYTYETDVLDLKQAAKLIAMGPENIKGPWICLICGTPGRALHFPTYYKFRRHLVEVHKEKPVANICEYCGHKALKRNYLLHHLYSKHDVKPPSHYKFPKCNLCNYIALSESLLIKHKLTHSTDGFRCNVCATQFLTSRLLLLHIQNTGHKYSADRKNNLQCIYCLKTFLRENNLCTHLKTCHKFEAKSDGILEDSDDDIRVREENKMTLKNNKTELKLESPLSCQNEYEEVGVQYQIQPDGNIHVISSKKQKDPPLKQKILNSGLNTKISLKSNTLEDDKNVHSDFLHHTSISSLNEENDEEIVMIDNNEYIVKNNQLIPTKSKQADNYEYIIPEIIDSDQNSQAATSTTSMEFSNVHSTNIISKIQQSGMIVSKSSDLNQPIQIFVSNEEEYKAVMASNNPIIFDNVDDNKTLTVLTAPPGTTLDTATINLNNAQSDDMMIIQEEFPLSAPDNVTADNNSNIVVVYSHPVDNQNKQYQLLTTQGIEAQFVPSSAIITQNYETVTTTAPVMNAHVISSQEVWQNDVHQSITNQELQITTEFEIQTIDKPENQITTQDNINETNLTGLPQVHLLQETQSNILTPQSNDEINDNLNKHTEITCNSESVNSKHEIVTLSMETENTKSLNDVSNHVKITEDTCNSENMVTDDNDNNEAVSQIETDVAITVPQMSEILENQKLTVQTPTTTCVSPTLNETAEETEENPVENVKEQNEQSTVDQSLSKGTMEQIKHLTSEWSDDEGEAQNPVSDSEEHNNDTLALENRTEIVESIENTQREVEKRRSLDIEVNIENQENAKSEMEDISELTLPDVSQSERTINSAQEINTPPEKISSLLNEWDDNDSEEASVSTENITPVVEHSQETPTSVVVDKKDVEKQLKPDDNIKILVSDWDDDEEENKDVN